MHKFFDGCFYKNANWSAYEEEPESYYFDDMLFRAVSCEIENILGKKDKCYVQDALDYFNLKYGAYQVPFSKFRQYLYSKPECIWEYPASQLCDINEPFDFYLNPKHECICLIIDTKNNTELRKKYPSIGKLEKNQIENDIAITSAEFVIIGSYDRKTIMSMYSETAIAIPEIDYAMWYFYKHS